MDLGILIVPALGGYLFLRIAYLTKFRLYRESGYHLVFWSASAGIFLFAGAYLTTPFTHPFYSFIGEWLGLPAINSLVATLVTTILLSIVLPYIINHTIYTKEKARLKMADKKGSHIEWIIEESYSNETWIELTLKNGKSYIGIALGLSLEPGITKPNESDTALLPFFSGYRDPNTHKLHITTNYSPVISTLEADCRKEGREVHDVLRIAIPISEIRSARPFDLKVYESFQEHKPAD